MKKFLLLATTMLCAICVKGQDKIIYKDGSVEEISITEVTPDYIKFKEFNSAVNSSVFTIEKEFLKKAIFENGRVLDFSSELINDPRIYAGQRNRAIKLDILSINENSLHFGYEQAITPSKSWEAAIIFIGGGLETQGFDGHLENAMGFGFISGIKFKRTPNFYFSRMRYGHILRGTYFRPNLNVNTFRYDLQDKSHQPDPATMNYPIIQANAVSAAVNIDIGNQIILSNNFLVDYSFGVGYGFTTKQYIPDPWWNSPPYPPANNYTFYGGRRQIVGQDFNGNSISYLTSPVTFVVNLKLGYLLSNK